MRWGWGAALGALALGAAGCTALRPTPPVTNGVQTGVASWYGPGFHGKRTANGEIYDQYELTAAHPSLPLGTRAMVTNLTNGRAVEVRINDRGPFVDGRVIDLSYAAARSVGMIGPGTAPVRVEVLETPVVVARASAPAPRPRITRARVDMRPAPAPPPAEPPAPEPALAEPQGSFAVQVATLTDAGRAEHLRQVLGSRFPDARVRALSAGAGRYYQVVVGPYPVRSAAVARAEMVNRLGYPAVILESDLQ